jgi:hypothetical protein
VNLFTCRRDQFDPVQQTLIEMRRLQKKGRDAIVDL